MVRVDGVVIAGIRSGEVGVGDSEKKMFCGSSGACCSSCMGGICGDVVVSMGDGGVLSDDETSNGDSC